MHLIYLQQSGKPVEGSSGTFWTLAGVAVHEDRWKTLQLRLNGLQKSFQKVNYKPGQTRINANDLLHPKNAGRPWAVAYCKGMEKIAATLDVKLFLVVVDKRTTDKPAHPKWLLPLTYHYLLKPISQFLRDKNSTGTLVIPPGREEERQTISEMQFTSVFSPQARNNPIVGSPLVQREVDSAGLQIADFVATVARRYHEHTYPKLFNKDILEGYDAIINSHYQGFVKPNTYQSEASDQKGFRIRGYIYLWRRDNAGAAGAQAPGAQSFRPNDELESSGFEVREQRSAYAPAPAPAATTAPEESPRAVAEEPLVYGLRKRRPPTGP